MKMTLEQLCTTYGYSEKSIKSNFRRTAQSFKRKYGLDLIKCTSYKGVYYQISSPRALTMYEEIKNEVYIPIESIKMDDLACFVLVGVAATPQGVFRGTRKDFLDYIGLSHSKKNVELLDQVLNRITNVQQWPLIYQEDGDFIIIYIQREFEKQRIINIKMLRECQEMARKYNKQSMKIIQLFKVWQAYRINEQKGIKPLTDKILQQYIDLSQKQISDIRKILEAEDLINTIRVGTAKRCYGHDYSTSAYY